MLFRPVVATNFSLWYMKILIEQVFNGYIVSIFRGDVDTATIDSKDLLVLEHCENDTREKTFASLVFALASLFSKHEYEEKSAELSKYKTV